MDLDDQITLSTPEGVTLQVTLAGVGSRFIAGAADLVLQAVLVVILGLVASAGGSGGVLGIVLIVGSFAIWFFYPVAFELLAAGRTPGKRFTHLRVIRESGAPIDLAASAIRNLMRVLDGPPLLYLPSLISVALTTRNQRPGDLAAGTVVIREPAGGHDGPVAEPSTGAATLQAMWTGVDASARWDASAVTAAETAAVRHFLARRETLDPGARRALAQRLATGLRPKVTGAPEGIGAETFLERLAEFKRGS
jgi:uncharacterized RDD family membrane protein YckC